MARLFIYGTSLGGIEQLMMLAPNFLPMRSGIVIQNYFNCEGGFTDCNYSVSNVRNRCNAGGCFGKINNNALKIRLKLLSSKFKGEIFLNNKNKERFYHVHHKQSIDIKDRSPSYIAVPFLLTADEILWKLSEHTVRLNGFDFSQIYLRQISTDGYA